MSQNQQTISFSHDCLIDTEGAGQLLKIPPATLVKWRSTGENNIPYVKIGKNVRYRTSDLKSWIEKHTRK